MSLKAIGAVAIGGAGGALARWGATRALTAWHGAEAAWSTLIVNALGAFLLGLCASLLAGRPGVLPLLVMVGFLGAFTTFSTFAMDAVMLFRGRSFAVASAYVAGSVGLALASFLGGAGLGRIVA
jgi:CrcB protein